MPRYRIPKNIKETVLLTEIFPFELPIPFSNWGSFNYFKNIKPQLAPNKIPHIVRLIFRDDPQTSSWLIPWRYDIKKNADSYRNLFLLHPGCSSDYINLYDKFNLAIIRNCQKSEYSLRSPHKIARYYKPKPADITLQQSEETEIVDIDGDEAEFLVTPNPLIKSSEQFAQNYFIYNPYSYLFQFFGSDEFTNLEKRFSLMHHLDVAKCFPSIYTHSISWAIEGKSWAKKRSGYIEKSGIPFSHQFDKLMQSCNYGETAGIPVGPEASRIFAEIILQEIDSIVQKTLETQKLIHGQDYACRRYIDDYYIFSNSEQIIIAFKSALRDELLQYNLHLNDDKQATTHRPFIDQIGITKTKVIQHLSNLNRLITSTNENSNDKIISQKRISSELNNLRAIIQNQGTSLYAYSNIFLSITLKSIKSLDINDKPELLHSSLLMLIEHFCHWLHLDTRINGIIFYTKLVNECTLKTNKLDRPHASTIKNRLFAESISLLNKLILDKNKMESISLLSAFEILGNGYTIPTKLLEKLIYVLRSTSSNNNTNNCMESIAILSLLRYIKNHPEYTQLKQECIIDSKAILSSKPTWLYAESAYLFLDIIKCPHIEKSTRNDLIKIALTHKHSDKNATPTKTEAEIAQIRNWIAAQDWYFDWGGATGIRKMLKKKRGTVTY